MQAGRGAADAGRQAGIWGRAGDAGMWVALWANAVLASRDWGYADVAGGRGRAGPQSMTAGHGARARSGWMACPVAQSVDRRGVRQGDPAELGVIHITAQTRDLGEELHLSLRSMGGMSELGEEGGAGVML